MEEQLQKLQFEEEEETEDQDHDEGSEASPLLRKPRGEVPSPLSAADNGSNGHGEVVVVNGGGNGALNGDKDNHGEGINQLSSDEDSRISEQNGFSNSVYFDKLQETWKCRHCDWNHKFRSPCSHVQNPKGYLHMTTSVQALDHFGLPSTFDIKDTESTHPASELQYEILNGFNGESDHQDEEAGDNSKSFDLRSSPLKVTHDNHRNSFNHPDKESEANLDIDSVEEIDEESIDYNLEKVIEKQNTHDLYCPNCECRITRTVILRRKLKTKKSHKKRKPAAEPAQSKGGQSGKTPAGGALDDQSFGLSNVERAPTPAHHDARPNVDVNEGSAVGSGPKPEAFRCLSCFSIFIPTGNCFRLLFVRDKHEGADQNAREVAAPRKKWFSSIFTSENGQAVGKVEPGTSRLDNVNTSYPPEAEQPQHTANEPMKAGNTEPHSGKATEYIKHHLNGSESTDISREKGSATGTVINEQLMGQQNNAATESENTDKGRVGSDTVGYKGDKVDGVVECYIGAGIVGLPVPGTAGHMSIIGTNFSAESVDASIEPGVQKPDTSVSSLESKNLDSAYQPHKPRKQGFLPLFFIRKLKPESGTLKESLLNKGTGVGTDVASDGAPAQEHSSDVAVQIDDNEAADASPQASNDREILKSIVYGGLLESITSLGVVSSAAGAGAATLNILVLGLANLVGGFIVLLHNLMELRNDHYGENSNQTSTRENRYQQLLGRRDDFWLHACVAILSYIIFGLVPPTVYGFSFRESGDREYKLVAVAGASLLCIFFLALGKGHITRPRRTRFKSVLTYLSMGVSVSGLSYLFGVLLERLFTKLGLLE